MIKVFGPSCCDGMNQFSFNIMLCHAPVVFNGLLDVLSHIRAFLRLLPRTLPSTVTCRLNRRRK
jgi:hypothetical protein